MRSSSEGPRSPRIDLTRLSCTSSRVANGCGGRVNSAFSLNLLTTLDILLRSVVLKSRGKELIMRLLIGFLTVVFLLMGTQIGHPECSMIQMTGIEWVDCLTGFNLPIPYRSFSSLRTSAH